jgi:hypothetical protein
MAKTSGTKQAAPAGEEESVLNLWVVHVSTDPTKDSILYSPVVLLCKDCLDHIQFVSFCYNQHVWKV